jgi:hypothetical protein
VSIILDYPLRIEEKWAMSIMGTFISKTRKLIFSSNLRSRPCASWMRTLNVSTLCSRLPNPVGLNKPRTLWVPLLQIYYRPINFFSWCFYHFPYNKPVSSFDSLFIASQAASHYPRELSARHEQKQSSFQLLNISHNRALSTSAPHLSD